MKLLRGLNWSARMARVVLTVNKPADVDLASPLERARRGPQDVREPADGKRG